MQQVIEKEAFVKLDEVYNHRHEFAREWKRRTGRSIFAFMCTYLPEEIVYASGALPVRAYGSHTVQDLTDQHMWPVWCPYSRDILYDALTGKYDYADAIVDAWCCQHIRGTYVSWWRHVQTTKYHHEIFWPLSINTKQGRWVAIKGFERFRNLCSEWTGHTITDKDLYEAIKIYNQDRQLMRQVYEMRKAPNPPISGVEAMSMVLASQVMDKKDHIKLMHETIEEIKRTKDSAPKAQIRLMTIGSEDDDRELLRFIESLGSTIVIDDHCTGSKYILGDVDEKKPDRIEAITDRYINKPACPQRDISNPGRRRPNHVVKLAQEWGAQGVIFLQQKFCDPHLWDWPIIQRALDKVNIPQLRLEIDVTTPVGQFRTRVEAFLETLSLEI